MSVRRTVAIATVSFLLGMMAAIHAYESGEVKPDYVEHGPADVQGVNADE